MAEQRIVISWENAYESEVLVEQITAIVMKHGRGDLPYFWGDLCSVYHRDLEDSTKAKLAVRLGMTPNQFYQKLYRLRLFVIPYLSMSFEERDICDTEKSRPKRHNRWGEVVRFIGPIILSVATLVSQLLDLL